jgi:hypothetical protein
MTTDESAGGGLFRDPLPDGFTRLLFLVPPGHEVDLKPDRLPDGIAVVEQGELELECPAGVRRRFGRGSMIPIARLPVARLRSVGPGPLVLVAVSRGTDDFPCGRGSYCDC